MRTKVTLSRMLLIFICLVFVGLRVNAQLVSNGDTVKINKRTKEQLYNFTGLLSRLVDTAMDPDDLPGYVEAAFDKKRIFRDSLFVIADDIDPSANLSNFRKRPIRQYLTLFEASCNKTDIYPAIDIVLLGISPLKKLDSNLHIRVFYRQQFKFSPKENQAAYQAQLRVADFTVYLEDHAYNPYLSNVNFIHPDSLAMEMASAEGNYPVVYDSLAYKNEQEEKEQEEKESRRKKFQYDALLTSAEHAEKTHDYAEAYLLYKQADQLNELDPQSLGKIKLINIKLESDHIVPTDYYYSKFIEKAVDAASKKFRYDKAIQYYQSAIEQKPGELYRITMVIDTLRRKLEVQRRLNELYRSGKYEAAKKGYRKALESDNHNTDLSIGLGRCLYMSGSKKDAVSTFQKALQANSGSTLARHALAEYYQAEGSYIDAITQYNILKVEEKFNPEISMHIAELKMRNGQTDDALAEIAEAIRINYYDAGLHVIKGQFLYNAHRYKQSNLAFNEALKLDSSQADAYIGKGMNYIELNDIDNAVRAFNEARATGADTASLQLIQQEGQRLYTLYVNNFDAYKKYANKVSLDSARTVIGYATRICPYNDLYFFSYGQLLAFLKEYPEAIEYYNKAIGLSKNYIESYIRRGDVYTYIGKYEVAINDYNAAIVQLKPYPEDALFNLYYLPACKGKADAVFYQERYKEAIVLYVDLLAKFRESRIPIPVHWRADVFNHLGRAYYKIEDDRNALECLETALRFDKNLADAYYNLSQLYARQKDKEKVRDKGKAIDNMKLALQLNENNTRWYFDLGDVCMKTSEKPEEYAFAAQAFSEVISRDKEKRFPQAVYYEGYCLFMEGMDQYPAALKCYETTKELNLDKEIPGFNIEIGYIYANIGRLDSAMKSFKTAYEANNLNAAACFGIGAVCYLQHPDDTEKYYMWFDKALQHRTLAKAFVKNPPLISKLKDEPRYRNLVNKYY